jgi:hypothetical protein
MKWLSKSEQTKNELSKGVSYGNKTSGKGEKIMATTQHFSFEARGVGFYREQTNHMNFDQIVQWLRAQGDHPARAIRHARKIASDKYCQWMAARQRAGRAAGPFGV